MKLGLDLKGGVHLVLRVNTDDALRLDTETTMEQLREAVGRQGHLRRRSSRSISPTQFKVEGIPQNQDGGVPRGGQRSAGVVQPGVRRRRHLHVHDEAEHHRAAARRRGDAGAADHRAARERAGRGRAGDRADGRQQRPDHRRAAGRHRRRARRRRSSGRRRCSS